VIEENAGKLKLNYLNNEQKSTSLDVDMVILTTAIKPAAGMPELAELLGINLDKYGFLPSCGPNSEALCIADPNEAWVFEVFSIGADWEPESGKPGAIWAAQRVPDDHIAIVPNWSIIKEIHPTDTNNFFVSKNYLQAAIDFGWFNPAERKTVYLARRLFPSPTRMGKRKILVVFQYFCPLLSRIGPTKVAKTPIQETGLMFNILNLFLISLFR